MSEENEEDFGGGKTDLGILCSQALLAFSGGLGFYYDRPIIAGAAYGISLVSGLVGFITNLTGDENVAKVSKHTTIISRIFVVPLIATEICCANGLRLELTLLNLLIPTVYYITKHVAKKEDFKPIILHTSVAISLAAISYFCILDENYWGLGMVLVYCVSCMGKELLDVPHLITASLGVGNLLYVTKVH